MLAAFLRSRGVACLLKNRAGRARKTMYRKGDKRLNGGTGKTHASFQNSTFKRDDECGVDLVEIHACKEDNLRGSPVVWIGSPDNTSPAEAQPINNLARRPYPTHSRRTTADRWRAATLRQYTRVGKPVKNPSTSFSLNSVVVCSRARTS